MRCEILGLHRGSRQIDSQERGLDKKDNMQGLKKIEGVKRWGFILLLLAGGFTSFASASPSTLRITIGTFSPYYSPKVVQIATGTPISWENPTYDLHTITHDGCKGSEHCAFDSGPLGPNQSYSIRHLSPGTYPYHCTLHPIMRGVLVVHGYDTSSDT